MLADTSRVLNAGRMFAGCDGSSVFVQLLDFFPVFCRIEACVLFFCFLFKLCRRSGFVGPERCCRGLEFRSLSLAELG